MGIGRSFRQYYEINDFTGGYNNVSKPTTLKPNEFSEVKNYNITRHRGLEKRGGITKLYSTSASLSNTSSGTLNYDSLSGAFLIGEIITGGTSSSTAVILTDNGTTQLTLGAVAGLFNDNEQIVGGTSGATANVNHPNGAVGVDGVVKNGAFVDDDDPPDDWTAGNAATLSTEGSGQVGNCLMITGNGTANPRASQTITLTVGETYTVSLYVKAGTEATWTAYIQGTINYFLGNSVEATASWVKHTITFVADKASNIFYLFQKAAGGAATTLYFDEISVYKVTSSATDTSKKVTSLYEYKAPNGSSYGLVGIGTKMRAYYNAQWNDLKTGLTSEKKYSFATHRGFCYNCNGVDANFKLHNTTSYNVGIVAPTAAPTVAAVATGTDALTATHPTANADTTGKLRSVAAETSIAQSFKLPADYNLSKVILKARKVGTPSGGTPAMWVEIHTSPVGTSTAKNASANIVTASSASANINPATGLTTAFADTTFTFSTAPVCLKDTTYYLVVYGDFTISTTNYVEVGFDNSDTAYASGMYHKIDGADPRAWTDVDTIDMVFEVYGTAQSETEQVATGRLETGESYNLMYSTTYYLLAQSFQLTSAASVTSLRIPLKETGNLGTDNIWAEIHSSTTGTSATKGASTNLVTNATTTDISRTSIDNDEFTWVTLTFSTAPSLSASTTYYLVLYSSGTVDTTNYAQWTYDSGTAYASGTGYAINSAFTWGSVSVDFSFKIYGTATAAVKAEEYATTNIVDYKGLREDTSHQMLAQAFVSDVTADCTKVVLYISQVGTIAGSKTIWAEIHDGQDGTSATQDSSDRINGTYATASATPDAISAYPTYDTITFTFSGTDPSLVRGTTYYLVLYGDYTASSTNYLKVQMDRLPPGYSDGNAWKINTDEEWTELPNADFTFQVHQATGGQTGSYKYIYTYKRSDIQEMEGNPSDESATVTPSSQSVNVTVVGTDETQVDDIIIYRTIASGETFERVDSVANPGADTTAVYKDDLADSELTTIAEFDNNVPPIAKYMVLHKDRIFYLNCPFEDNGGSLAMWSKGGNGEQVPTLNYQYFDKDDGEEITGGASLGDYLLVFKKNKIGILAGSLDAESELWYLSRGIGAVAHGSILPFEDKIVFLSEEGWKATDGTNIWSLSTQINGLIGDGYFTDNEILYPDFRDNYSAVYYPEKEHFQFLINHNTLDDYVFVGHFVAPLLLESQGLAETQTQPVVRWTRHQYDNHTLTCLGTYTDSSGITKVIAGASDGFVYLLDSGDDDDGTNIATSVVTDWLNLGLPGGITKTVRRGYVEWTADASTTAIFTVDIDYNDTDDYSTLTNDTTGTLDAVTSAFTLKGTGRVFRFSFTESSQIVTSLSKISIFYRDQGLR